VKIAFRKVGEATGERSDLDNSTQQLSAFGFNGMEEEWNVGGGYRNWRSLHATWKKEKNIKYTAQNCSISCDMEPYFEQGIELGRSFIQPKYWGKTVAQLRSYLNRMALARYARSASRNKRYNDVSGPREFEQLATAQVGKKFHQCHSNVAEIVIIRRRKSEHSTTGALLRLIRSILEHAGHHFNPV